MSTVLWVIWALSAIYLGRSLAKTMIGLRRSSKFEKEAYALLEELKSIDNYVREEKYLLDMAALQAECDRFDMIGMSHQALMDQWDAELENIPINKEKKWIVLALVLMVSSHAGVIIT